MWGTEHVPAAALGPGGARTAPGGSGRFGEPSATRRTPRRPVVRLPVMCRNIRPLHNFEPSATDDEVGAAALQYVRKVSGSTKPSRQNAEAFDRAVEEVALATSRLLGELVTAAPPKDREVEAAKRRARAAERYAA